MASFYVSNLALQLSSRLSAHILVECPYPHAHTTIITHSNLPHILDKTLSYIVTNFSVSIYVLPHVHVLIVKALFLSIRLRYDFCSPYLPITAPFSYLRNYVAVIPFCR